jgi:hypothetical protein
MNFDSFYWNCFLFDLAFPFLLHTLHTLGQNVSSYHVLYLFFMKFTMEILRLLVDLLQIDHQAPLIQLSSFCLWRVAFILDSDIAKFS